MSFLVYRFVKYISWDLILVADVTSRLVAQAGLCDLRA